MRLNGQIPCKLKKFPANARIAGNLSRRQVRSGLHPPPRIHVFCRHVETRRKCPLTAGFSNASFESLVLRKGTRPISGLSLCGKKSRSWRRKGVVPRSFAYELSLQEALRLKPANAKAGIRAGSDRAAQTAT